MFCVQFIGAHLQNLGRIYIQLILTTSDEIKVTSKTIVLFDIALTTYRPLTL
jgi:hypothetical protein